MRQYTRQSTEIPIAASIANQRESSNSSLVNLSVGGLCCESSRFIPIGTIINIGIPIDNPIYVEQGVVSWCNERQHEVYDVGICFNKGNETFRSRMVEQVCQIEEYKKEVLEAEGRALNSEQAAKEWINKYADSFRMSTNEA